LKCNNGIRKKNGKGYIIALKGLAEGAEKAAYNWNMKDLYDTI
jgi:hypothetical protein